ncbi:MAG: hypothetical protein MR274_03500 [Clostridium sp.]|nr:hypothetical protein [Clostridium sp.]
MEFIGEITEEIKSGCKNYGKFGDEIKFDDFFSITNTLLTFSDGLKNKYNFDLTSISWPQKVKLGKCRDM